MNDSWYFYDYTRTDNEMIWHLDLEQIIDLFSEITTTFLPDGPEATD